MTVAAYKKKVLVADNAEGPWHLIPSNTASLTQGGTMLDDTKLGSHGYRSRLVGILDWGVSLTGLYEPGDDALDMIRQAQLNREIIHIQYLPDGTLQHGYQGPCVVETYNSSGGVDDLETVEISLQSNGALGDANS